MTAFCTYCQKVRIAFSTVLLALGLIAGFGAGCQSESKGSGAATTVMDTITVVYEMEVGNGIKSYTCITDGDGQRCVPSRSR